MDPITLASLGASAIPAIFKLFSGNNQVKQANELAKSNVFTPYQIPTQVGQATEMLGNNYRNGMPTTAAENRIAGSSQTAFNNGVMGASSGGDVLDLATKVNFNQDQALNGLNEQAIKFRDNALGAYVNQLGNEAAYEDKAYQTNVLDPYNRKANAASSMYGAGKTNMFSGLDSLSTSALAGATAYQNYKKSGS